MWEFLCSPLRNNPGIRPRIYVGYNTLDRAELEPYLAHRLRLAGCELPLFEPPAVEALFQAARGLPRQINRIAHYALWAAALDQAHTVNHEHLQRALDDLRP